MSDATSTPSVLPRPDYIDDGYNEQFSIPASPGAEGVFGHGPLTGTLRPCFGIDGERARDAYKRSGADYFAFLCEALPKYVLSWDLKDRSGNALPIDSKTVGGMNRYQRAALGDIVFYESHPIVEAALKNLP